MRDLEVYSNLGQTQLSEQNRQKAFELRDRASEREKLYITAHYYADSGQLDKGITAYDSIVKPIRETRSRTTTWRSSITSSDNSTTGWKTQNGLWN